MSGHTVGAWVVTRAGCCGCGGGVAMVGVFRSGAGAGALDDAGDCLRGTNVVVARVFVAGES